MGLLDKFKKEKRSSNIEDPTVPISNSNILAWLGVDGNSASGVNVTTEKALTVPAFWAGYQFLSSTLAGLPLHVYKKTDEGRERHSGMLEKVLHDAWTEDTSSFDGRKYTMERVLTGGRGLIYIERNTRGEVINLFPLDPRRVTVIRQSGKKTYKYCSESGKTLRNYKPSEIIDIPFALECDKLKSISPINKHKDTLGLAIASTQYGSRFFQNGGVPPFVLIGNFQSGAALKRASNDLEKAIKESLKDSRQAVTIPAGHELKPLGVDPEKSQLVELKRFLLEEIARIFSLPPVFLQDLTRGTFSNTEQQDLHLVKHTIRRWVVQFEQELNLKLFGRENPENLYVEFNLDGLLRGDFSTRMSGYATAIQNAIMKPEEARNKENLPRAKGADVLLVQGATVPLGSQPNIRGSENEE